jgi:hypothetical protein
MVTFFRMTIVFRICRAFYLERKQRKGGGEKVDLQQSTIEAQIRLPLATRA